MKQLKKVQIFLPVYNEAQNIEQLIHSIYKQETITILISDVVVVCDGSSDETPSIIKKLMKKYRTLKLIHGTSRKGKLFRLNEIYKKFNGHVLVLLDGDIALEGTHFIENLVHPICVNQQIKLVSSNEVPIQPSNFFGKIIYFSFLNWDYVVKNIPNQDTVHSFGGAATAYNADFVSHLHIPKDEKEERLYLFLLARKQNGYHFNKHASIRYWPVSTFKDYLGLLNRSFGEEDFAIEKQFGGDTEKYVRIPIRYKITGIFHAFIRHPIFTVLGVIMNFITGNFKISSKVVKDAIWEFSESTKKPVPVKL